MRTWIGRVLLVFSGMLISVILLEFLLRIASGLLLPANLQLALQVQRMVQERSQMFYDDPELGHVLKPGLDVDLALEEDFQFHVRTSDLGLGGPGFRDANVHPPVYAVAIGDSFTYGLGVEEEETWVAQLQQRLGKEVVNLGQPGVGPVREARIYQQYGRPLQPSIVLWMLFPNDLEDAMVFNGFGRSKAVGPDIWDRVFTALRPWSRLALLVEFSLGRGPFTWAGGYEVHPVAGELMFFHPDQMARLIDFSDPYIEKGWWISRNSLTESVQAAKADGSRFILILAPPRERVYIHLLTDDPANAPFNTDALFTRYKQLGKDLDIEVIDLTDSFVQAAQAGERLYLTRDGHWNAAGHALVAKVLANYLETNP